MNPENDIVVLLAKYRQLSESRTETDKSAPLQHGGGGGTSDGMEARVKALEDKFEKIDGKLDKLVEATSGLRADIAFVKGKLDAMPSSETLGALRGRVESLPTIPKVAGLLAIAVAVFTIIDKWPVVVSAIKAAFANP